MHGRFLVRDRQRIGTEGRGCVTVLFGTFCRHRLLEGNHLLGSMTRLDLVRRDRNIRRGWNAGCYRFVNNRFVRPILHRLSTARRSESGLDGEVGFRTNGSDLIVRIGTDKFTRADADPGRGRGTRSLVHLRLGRFAWAASRPPRLDRFWTRHADAGSRNSGGIASFV